MAIPNESNLETLDFAYLGAPFADVDAKSVVDTRTLDYAYLGAPFVGAQSTYTPPVGGLNVYVNVAGTWKQATAAYVKVAGVWKSVTTVSTKVAGVWKA